MGDLIPALNGALAGRYEIDREIGRGGMAVVFRARDLKHERWVAIKVLKPELSPSLAAERFLREIRLAAGLQHPHILPVHDSGEAGGLLYYVMPYVEGESLRTRIDSLGSLPIDEALRITRQVADALHHAHQRDVVHRDIKPENILLSGEHALVADFGIARAVSAASGMSLTETGLAVGTPAYMSPEQASAESRIDARADVYALGCVLYEMLAGEPPFRGPTSQSILSQHTVAPPPSVRRIRPTTSPAIEAAITKALAKAPSDRFPSAQAFAASLPVSSATDIPAATTGRSMKLLGTAAALVILSVGGWFGTRLFSANRPDSPVSIAVLPIQDKTNSGNSGFAEGLTQEITTALTRVQHLAPRPYATVNLEASKQPDPLALGRRLDVDYVLVSTIRRSGNRVRMSAELIDVKDGTNAWAARSFQGYDEDLFQMQDSIASQLVRQLAGEFSRGATLVASTGRGRRDPEAYRLYNLGRQVNAVSAEGSKRAVDLFSAAIERDSTFADAWAALASAIGSWSQYSSASPVDLMRRRVDALNRAIALDSMNSEAWQEKALLTRQLDWDMDGATRHYKRAIALAPSSAWAHDNYAQHLLETHGRTLRDSAVRVLNRAIALDPTNSHFAMIRGWSLIMVDSLDAASEFLDRSLALDRNNWVAYLMRSRLELRRGRPAEAVREQEKSHAIQGPDDPFTLSYLGRAYGEAGQASKARDVLTRLTALANRGYVEQAWFAIAQLGLKDKSAALSALEASANAREFDFLLAMGSSSAALWNEPRYEQLLRRVGLDRYWKEPFRF